MTIVIMLSIFVILLLVGFPVAVSILLSSAVAIFIEDIPLMVILQRQFTSVDSFTLMAIPFFLLAGLLMEAGGISRRLINFANSIVSNITGGLGMVVVVAAMFFAAISGSSAATVAALGAILIPAMIKKGYAPNFAAGLTAVSGELGVIIPPSIALLLFGVSTNTSINDLFMAGILPGLMIGGSLLLTVYIFAKIRRYPKGEKSSWVDKISGFKDAFLALLMPLIILGGIYSGVFTPTEAAAIAVAYAFIVGRFIYKELTNERLYRVIKQGLLDHANILIIIGSAGVFGWILGRLNFLPLLSDVFTTVADNPIVFLLLVNIVLLVVGMFLEASAAIIILAPLLTPLAIQYGVDPVHFGLIMVVNLAIGMCTPPVGVNLFIAARIANISIMRIIPGTLPFLLVMILNLIILTFFPAISMLLPNLLE